MLKGKLVGSSTIHSSVPMLFLAIVLLNLMTTNYETSIISTSHFLYYDLLRIILIFFKKIMMCTFWSVSFNGQIEIFLLEFSFQ